MRKGTMREKVKRTCNGMDEMVRVIIDMIIFFFNDTATTEIYTLSLHDALPIYLGLTSTIKFEVNCFFCMQVHKQVLNRAFPRKILLYVLGIMWISLHLSCSIYQ